ncbi:hypothetical protein LJC48_01220 [Desulfovibrio sp. OttesenSCG-928-C06]|nr:hypothetical protein [Desulfovibrio sp. OttesenSCG-928-C06]
MAEFTTWSALLADMKADLASGAWRTMSSYSVPGPNGVRSVSYRSLDEFMDLYKWVEDEAVKESGIPLYRGRTRAGQGGRG